jgi:predicted amidohydrolase
MASFTAACVQMRSGKTLAANVEAAEALIRAAARDGARYIQTPEMSNVLVRSREELFERISEAEADPFLAMARRLAAELNVYLHLGSLAVLAGGARSPTAGS